MVDWRKKGMFELRIATLGFLLCAEMLSVAVAIAEPVRVRSGYTVAISGYSPLILENKAVLKHLGTSYVLDPEHFRSTSLELSALAAGEVDIISIAYSTFAVAVLNAHLDDIRIVADGNQDGVGDHRSVPFLVKNDGGIKTVEDMKGRVAASNGAGGAFDIAMRWMLYKHGLEDKRDYTVVETDFANMSPMLLSGKADLVIGAEPFVDIPEMRQNSHPLFTTRDAMGPSQMTVMASRSGFLAKNHAALVDFFEDMMASFRWFREPANHEAAVAMAARVTHQPAGNFADFIFTDKDFYRDPDLRPNLNSLQRNIAIMKELGYVKGDVDVQKYADLSLIDEARQRLK